MCLQQQSQAVWDCSIKSAANRQRGVNILLHLVLVGLEVGYCVQFSFLQFKRGIEKVERVQQKAVRLKNMVNEERLKELIYLNIQKGMIWEGSNHSLSIPERYVQVRWMHFPHMDVW